MNLRDIDHWQRRLGLIAVPLDPSSKDRFVMLNGARGNFCLDLRPDAESSQARSVAWSADVGHYVHVQDGHVSVQRWDLSDFARPTYSARRVASEPEGFQSYLERDEPSREHSIVRHLTAAFGIVRRLTHAKAPSIEPLGAFLVLIACAIEGATTRELSAEQWGLEEADLEIAGTISADDWKGLIAFVEAGLESLSLRPHLDYTLRHAAGQVFQEAHYMAEPWGPTQLRFGQSLPEPARSKRRAATPGVFFTPPYLARALAQQAMRALGPSAPGAVVFDPACGSGEILREAVRQISATDFRGSVTLRGWDVSPIACKMARFVLAWERQHSRAGATIRAEVRQLDSLNEEAWPEAVDLVLMNPPFLSYGEMSTAQRSKIKRSLGSLAHGRIDMASAFLLRGARAVRAGGVLGSLMPASLLTGDSAKLIRADLSSEFATHLVGRLGDQSIFTGALVDAGIYVGLRRGGDRPNDVGA